MEKKTKARAGLELPCGALGVSARILSPRALPAAFSVFFYNRTFFLSERHSDYVHPFFGFRV